MASSFSNPGIVTLKESPGLTSLRAFSVVRNCLRVTGAARQIGVTQSAVSRQIKALEDTLDFKLFDRAGTGMTLSDASHARFPDQWKRVRVLGHLSHHPRDGP